MNGLKSRNEETRPPLALLSDKIAEKCGEVSIGSSNVAGLLQGVMQSSEALGDKRRELVETFESLEQDQRKAADASDEASELSRQGSARLTRSIELINTALGEITSLLELVEALEKHVIGFVAALEQVRNSTSQIDEIAGITSILALNAMIEAARAGEVGNSFSVVANEVKRLAAVTSEATSEISVTVEKFSGEARMLIENVELGAKTSRRAKNSVGQIEETVSEVAQVFAEVDLNNQQITRSTGAISKQVGSAREVIRSFESASIENASSLNAAHQIVGELEVAASEMFDSVVKGGLSPEDSEMVERAIANRDRIEKVTREGIESGALDLAALFDTDYTEIKGPGPTRYRTGLSNWADDNWRPLLDEMKAVHTSVSATVCSDMNGFLPTHRTERSRAPTGDRAHDDAYCRNGCFSIGPMTRKAKESEDAYQMAIYRHIGDGEFYKIVRNVYVPLIIDGRRWGDVELAYSL